MGWRKRAMLRRTGRLLPAAVLASLACGGEDLGVPGTGTLEITTATSGAEPDADGYGVIIDDGAVIAIGTDDAVRREGVEAGPHTLRLVNLAPNCSADASPRTVEVVAGETARVDFAVTCSATAGAIRISVTTSGTATDPDGYLVRLDDAEPGLAVGSSGEVSFTEVPAGSHVITLSGLAADCSVGGGPSHEVTVESGKTAEVAFAVACAQPSGSLQLTTVTTGSAPDADGYTVRIDDAEPRAIGTSGTLSLDGLALGSHLVTLGGIAPNCHLQGANPRMVTVAPGSATVTLSLTCLGADALIAFTSNGFGLLGIFIVRPDGSGLRNLTPDNVFESGPVWSPDGTRILFVRDGDLYVMEADGGGRKLLVEGEQISEYRWSPDGRRIAFVDVRPAGEDAVDDLWVMRADGSEKRRLAEQAFNFSWSPDGRVVYTSVADFGDVHLRIIKADATGDVRLTHGPAAFEPAWSPDGKRIAYVTLEERDIIVVDPDGANETNLTNGASEDETPVWSPDGSRIAFTMGSADEFFESEIGVMGPDGSGRTAITHRSGLDFQPVWSPDGTKLVYTGSDTDTGDSEIYVVNADGTNPVNISGRPETLETTPDWNGQGPTVMASGRQAAFYRRLLGAHRLHVPLREGVGAAARP